MKNEKLPRNIGTVLKSYQKVVEIDTPNTHIHNSLFWLDTGTSITKK